MRNWMYKQCHVLTTNDLTVSFLQQFPSEFTVSEPVFGDLGACSNVSEDHPLNSTICSIPVTDEDGLPQDLVVSIESQTPHTWPIMFEILNNTLMTSPTEQLDAETEQSYDLRLR